MLSHIHNGRNSIFTIRFCRLNFQWLIWPRVPNIKYVRISRLIILNFMAAVVDARWTECGRHGVFNVRACDFHAVQIKYAPTLSIYSNICSFRTAAVAKWPKSILNFYYEPNRNGKKQKKKKLFHGGADYSLEKQCTYVWRLVNVEVLVVHHSANHVYKNSPRTINFKLLEIIRTVSTFISDWRRQPIYHSNARFGMFGMRNWLSDSWMWSLSKLSKLAAIMHVRHA